MVAGIIYKFVNFLTTVKLLTFILRKRVFFHSSLNNHAQKTKNKRMVSIS